MTTVVIEKINNNKVDIIGKTFNSVDYSGDVGSRERISGQTFITTNDIKEGMTIRGDGRDTPIRKVEPMEKAEVFIQLLNAESIEGSKSLASAILKGVWTAKGVENPELSEIFVMDDGSNTEALREIKSIANAMARTELGMRAMGKWYPVVDGKRVIIRIIAEIDKGGNIVHNKEEACIPSPF